MIRDLDQQEEMKGYLLYSDVVKREDNSKQMLPGAEASPADVDGGEDDKHKDKIFKDFAPVIMSQFSTDKVMEYESFD